MSTAEIKPVGVAILEKNGVDVDALVKQLIKNASVEFTAYYYFTNLRMHCVGVEGEGSQGCSRRCTYGRPEPL